MESKRTKLTRGALGFLAFSSATIGIWATATPRSFYDEFPGLGSMWVAADGPYNEHLIRDVGALNLALTLLLIAAAWTMTRETIIIAATASAVWGAPHFVYHLFNTEGLSTRDAVSSLAGLAAFLLLSLWLLITQLRAQPV